MFALLNPDEAGHEAAAVVLREDGGPFLVPALIMSEIAYVIEKWLDLSVLDSFLLDLLHGAFSLAPAKDDLRRVRVLVRRYADLRLGFADAAVIACAERNGGRVLTFDRRHFGVVAREGTITPLPA